MNCKHVLYLSIFRMGLTERVKSDPELGSIMNTVHYEHPLSGKFISAHYFAWDFF